jgi:hypothetical protein
MSDIPTYLPTCSPHKKPKIPTETAKKQTPHRDFKSFRLDGSSREMGILSKPSARATNFEYLCSMTIEIHNMIPRGLNVGFEFYSEDDLGGPQDFYELHINLLLIKVIFFWDK